LTPTSGDAPSATRKAPGGSARCTSAHPCSAELPGPLEARRKTGTNDRPAAPARNPYLRGRTQAQTRAVTHIHAGRPLFVLVAAIQLVRFRQLNGVRLGGLASRVVLGTATAASISYVLALGASAWAGFNRMWWLVAVCAIAGGAAYALSGLRWWRRYQGDPTSNSRGESAGLIAIIGALAVAGVVLLVLGR
jgi:hypothetical protein